MLKYCNNQARVSFILPLYIKNGETALLFAAKEGNLQLLELLLKAKANIDARDKVRRSLRRRRRGLAHTAFTRRAILGFATDLGNLHCDLRHEE